MRHQTTRRVETGGVDQSAMVAASIRNAATGQMGRRNFYVYDNTARRLDMESEIDIESRYRQMYRARKNREKASYMNPGYVMFLAVALLVSAVVLIGYVRLRSEITASVNHISRLESQLNTIKQSNDAEYARIENSVNLEEVKRAAIEDLGMTYATAGQVVQYDAAHTDYVRQVAELPQKE